MPKLSELEGCVLGLVWAGGPCTPYAIRQIFLSSPSPHWSGSAGAIYPLVRRLERRRLLRSETQATGRRRSRLYALTPAGTRALQAWLSPPLPEVAVGVPADPLRTRLRFLEALPQARRRAFLADARARLHRHLRLVQADCRKRRASGDRFDYLMARGALHQMRAREAWLREVARAMKGVGKQGSRRRGA